MNFTKSRATTRQYLIIPLGIGYAQIPLGMSEDDFDLLISTLNLWKRGLVKPKCLKTKDVKLYKYDDSTRKISRLPEDLVKFCPDCGLEVEAINHACQ